MADPALNPRNPDDATKAAQAPDAGAPAESEELDLEAQVDALLAEVSDTVEEISRKLDPEPKAEPDAALSGNEVIDDEGSLGIEEAEPEAADAETGGPDASETPAFSFDEDDPEALARAEAALLKPEGSASKTPPPDPGDAPPDYTDTAALDDELSALADDDELEAVGTIEDASEQIDESAETPEAEAVVAAFSEDPEPIAEPASVSAESVQAELEAALADLGGAPADPDEAGETPPEPAPVRPAAAPMTLDDDPDALAEAERSLLRHADAATETSTPTSEGPPADYTDAEALDDELAALAADDDLESVGAIESIADPEPAEPIAPRPDATPAPAAATQVRPAPTEAPADPAPAAEPRWGWLPPKPEWDDVYGRARWMVIAWRHIAWVVPPLSVFLWEKAKIGARRAEPHIRHAVAVVAAPLSRRDERTRSMIGYLSVSTLFWAACVWLWVLVGRGPVVPTPDAPPTTLAGETSTASARN